MRLTWLGNSSYRIETSGKVIYIDPYNVSGISADIILTTHEHYDHCDVPTIRQLSKESTIILGSPGAVSKTGKGRAMRQGDTFSVGEVSFEATAAYNGDKSFHPRGLGVGFIIDMEGKRLYHAGDTDFIMEMKSLKDVTCALLPVGGTYTMGADEAVEAVKSFNPVYAIPMHYGPVAGSVKDALRFKRLVEEQTGTKVYILNNGDTIEL